MKIFINKLNMFDRGRRSRLVGVRKQKWSGRKGELNRLKVFSGLSVKFEAVAKEPDIIIIGISGATE